MGTRAILFCLLFCANSLLTLGQSCNCPAVCAPCSGGGLTRIELRFNQPVDQHIEADAFDIGGVNSFDVAQFPVLGTVVLIGSKQNDRFVGDKVTIKVNGLVDVVINTRCSDNVLVGDTYGSFTVVAAESKNGGSVCCNASVNQNRLPIIKNRPGNIEVQVFDQACSGPVTWIPPFAEDNCQIVSFTEGNTPPYIPGDLFPIGSTQIVYTATDNNGGSSECIFEVIRIDKAPPVFDSFPQDKTAFATATCTAPVTWDTPIARDCSGVTLSSTRNSGVRFSVGVTPVTYTAIDGFGNRAERSFTVTVVDNAKPTFNITPSDITVQATDCGAVVFWVEPTADDNCPAGVTVTKDHSPGETFPIGTTAVNYLARDVSGNTSPYSFKVIVEDKTAPVISLLPNVTQLLTTACDVVVNWTEPLVTDNCKFKVTSNFRSGDRFGLGTFKVIYTAKDSAQNTSTSSFDIIVQDNSFPVFAGCPITNIEKDADPISCKAKVSWTVPTASDNCLDGAVIAPVFKPGDEFPIGTTIITYTAKDKAGNTSRCEFSIIVSDKNGPTVTSQPADMTANANASCKANVNWTLPTATDNCSTPISFSSSNNPNDLFPFGTTKVTYTIKDKVNNTSEVFFNITVNDITAPVFTGCPADITISSSNACRATVNWAEPTAIDNCSGSILPTPNFKPGAIFETGTTEVIYIATDNVGNTSTCKFKVIVRNESVPVISGCPQDIVLKTDETGKAVVTWDEPTATDQCGNVPLTASQKPNTEFGVGTTKITYESAPNSAGVRARCEFNVILSYKEIEFEVSKAITPNGDPVNENWEIRGLENFSDNEVLVVDRWGNKIFQASKYDNRKVVWNGTNSSGAIVPTGTYFYSVVISFQGKRVEKKGSVEVVK
jgi:gliding motility-associated-like protein